MITMLPAIEEDARELALVLRAEDRDEVLALGRDPVEGLLQSVACAREAWTYRDGSRIICMAGVGPLSLIGHAGVPWVLGSDLVPAHRRAFLVETRRTVARWLTIFPLLSNVVDARYDAAIRWLRWLGFTIGEPFPLGQGLFRAAYKKAA